MDKVDLTAFTDAGGCGCKISGAELDNILRTVRIHSHGDLFIGNNDNDDAAVLRIDENRSLLFTNDFFSPIVDDPYDFGRIAACNSLSDIYAMGGKPIIALSILGWPVDQISTIHARALMEGARDVCTISKTILAGGHTINNPQPFFGLSVTGDCHSSNIKHNSALSIGSLIYLTKPIGTGIYSTAIKLKKILPNDQREVIEQMTTLNSIGQSLANLGFVRSMTDVTGFGLLGHMIEQCKASKVSMHINFSKIPQLKHLRHYYDNNIVTSGGKRNAASYSRFLDKEDPYVTTVLCDPQTNGGLLITVDPSRQKEFEEVLKDSGYANFASPIGLVNTLPVASEKLIHMI